MKKIIALIIVLATIFTLASCGDSSDRDSNKFTVITTIFPEYDWVRNIVGNAENVEIKMLIDSGVDLHSFQPTAQDIMTISECDMFIYTGGESDKWVDDVLKEATNKDMVVVNLMDELGDAAKEEEVVEGMQAEDEEHEEHEHDALEEAEYDEHIWLSLKNASVLTKVIADKLTEADAKNKDTYQTNYQAYNLKLQELDGEYQSVVDSARLKTVVFGDRFPFRYLVDDYGLTYYAAFLGCSAESEASFDTIIFLANKVDEIGAKVILKLEGTDDSIAKTVNENTKTKDLIILPMDSMQSVTKERVEEGADYIELMYKNLDILTSALNN